VQVIAIREDRAAAPEGSVRGPREARGEGLHAGGEILLARRLQDEVGVVRLDRVVGDAEASSVTSGPQAFLEILHESHGAK